MGRITELDALRGIAAIVIVVFHMRFVNTYPVMGSAVDLFFVLSGYLITTIILAQGQRPGFFRTFYARRALRIWPIYYLGLFACVLLNPLMAKPERLDGFWHYFAYLQHVPAYWGGETPPFSRLYLHSWTLAIEEQFYLLWPLAVVLLGRKHLRLAIVPLLILPIVLRAQGYYRHLLFVRCDSLALGALLADLFFSPERVQANRVRYQRVFISIAACSLVAKFVVGPLLTRLDPVPGGFWAVWTFAFGTTELSLIYFSIVGLVLMHQGGPRLAWLRHRALVRVGTISYGVYLYHPFVLIFFPMIHRALGIKGSPWMDVVKLGVCIALAELSWRCVERPILSLKDRFDYRPAAHTALAGPHRKTGNVVASRTSE